MNRFRVLGIRLASSLMALLALSVALPACASGGNITVGSFPIAGAITPDGTKAYVSNYSDNTVSVIDTSTDLVTTTISGFANPFGIAITPDGTKAYVGNSGANDILVIDTATDSVTNVIFGLEQPFRISLTPDGAKAYVTNASSHSIAVLDTSTDTLIGGPILVSDFGSPLDVAVSVDGTKAYVAIDGDDTVVVIDTATDTVITGGGYPIPVGSSPQTLAVSPDGAKVYVGNYGSNTLSVIDASTDTVATTISGFHSPFGAVVSPDSSRIYVPNNTCCHGVSIVSAATDAITGTYRGSIDSPMHFLVTPDGLKGYSVNASGTVTPVDLTRVPVGTQPREVAVTPDGTKAYVTNYGSNSVSVIDTASDLVSKTIGVGLSPFHIAVSPDGAKVYVSNTSSNSVSVIDTSTDAVTGTISGINLPEGIVFAPDGQTAFVASLTLDRVFRIDVASGTVLVQIFLGAGTDPYALAVTPDGTKLLVSDMGTNKVHILDTGTNEVIGSPITVPGDPIAIAVTPDGTKAYVPHENGTVSVIDIASGTLIGGAIHVGTALYDIVVSPDGKRAYATDQNENVVYAIDTATDTVVGSAVATGTAPQGLAMTPSGSKMYVANLSDNDVSSFVFPKVDVDLSVVNDDGGVGLPGDFFFRLDGGTPFTAGTTSYTFVGDHALTAVSHSGYRHSSFGGDCASGGTVTLALRDAVTCTVTEDDQSPHRGGPVLPSSTGQPDQQPGFSSEPALSLPPTVTPSASSETVPPTDAELGITRDADGHRLAPVSGRTGPSPLTDEMQPISTVRPGQFIRSPGFPGVYLVTDALTRRPFMDTAAYFTLTSSFDQVVWVTDATLPTLPMGAPVLPKAGVVFVKIMSVPDVYEVEAAADGTYLLHALASETVASGRYGTHWADYVIDVDPTVFHRYAMGADQSDATAQSLTNMKTRAQLAALSAGHRLTD